MHPLDQAIAAFNEGRLAEAIEAATAAVRERPTDLSSRNLLCELLCFRGELPRVDKQLETIALQNPELAMSVSLFRQLVRAELARQECYRQGRTPEVLREPTPLIRQMLALWLARREQDAVRADPLAAEIEAARPPAPGTHNGQPFTDFRDCHDPTSFFFEVLTSTGKYYWVPFDLVESVEFQRPTRPRELLWRPTQMVVTGGPDGMVFVPTLYAGSAESTDPDLQTGRQTDWVGREGGCISGIGRRLYLVGDQDLSILELGTLTFRGGGQA